MKTKLFLLTLLNFILLNSTAQNITVNITTQGHDPKVCDSTTFAVQVILTGNFNFSNLQFGIEDIGGLTFSNGPVSANINGTNYWMFSQGPVSCTSSCTINFNFKVSYACSFTPQTNVTSGQVITVQDSLIITDGLVPYTGNINWTYDNNPLANPVLSYDLKYFYLAWQGAPATAFGNIDTPQYRKIIYKNTGNTPFNGAIEFHDNFLCDDYRVTEIKLYERTGTVDNLIDSFIPAINGTDRWFTYDSLEIDPDNFLVIEEEITIDSCLESCAIAGTNISMFNISWGCIGNLCRVTPVFNSTVTRSLKRPKVTMYRILPAPSGNLPDSGYWDQGCPPSPGNEIHWQFRIANEGDDAAYKLMIPLQNSNFSSYFIDYSSVVFTYCPAPCNLSHHQSHELQSMTSPHLKCAETISQPLLGLTDTIDVLKPGEYIMLNFTTKYCCPGSSDGTYTSPNVINLFEVLEKDFNTWRLWPVGKDECGTQISYTSESNPPAGRYKTFHYFGQNERWHLQQTFDPATSDMTGQVCPNGCNQANPVSFQIVNTSLNAEYLPGGTYGKSIATIFSTQYNNNPALMPVSVRIKLVFTMGDALRLYPLSASDIYIQNGATVWNPSVLPTADACSSSSNTRTYEVIFSDDSLMAALSQDTLDLKRFMQFINGSFIKFPLIACCCAATYNPSYEVKTYIEGLCQDCWIPMSKVGGTIHVHCPGCLTPGAQTLSSSFTRAMSSLGFSDTSNAGIKDSSLPIDTATYSQKNNIRYDRSIQGDTVVGIARGRFFPGSGPGCSSGSGMIYDTLITRTCNTTNAPCTSTVSTPYVFSHLYFDQTIPYSDADQFNLRLQACTLLIIRGTDTLEYILSGAETSDVNTNHHIGSQFRFDFTPSGIEAATGESNFAFTPNEEYYIRTTYVVCSNYDPHPESELLNDNKWRSEVFNAFYFSVMSLPQMPFPEYVQFGDTFIDETPASQNYNCNGLCHNYIFQCSPVSSIHYFYTIHTKTYYGSGFVDSQRPCIKIMLANAISTIGGGIEHYRFSTNIFPYEFRPAPVFNKFRITIPPGYKVKPYSARWGNIFATYGVCYPYTQSVTRQDSVPVPSTGSFDVLLTTIDAGPGMELNMSCDYDQPDSILIKGDENTFFNLYLELEVEDCQNTPALDTINIGDILTEFQSHDCDATGPVTDDMSTCLQCRGILHAPEPFLTITPFTPATVSSNTFVDTIRVTNPSDNPVISFGHDAENAFIYFPPSPNYLVDSVISISPGPAPQFAHGFWRLGIITADGTRDYKVKFKVLNCTGASGNIPIPFIYGWNCYTYPDTITDPICDTTLSYMYYQESNVSVFNSLVINENNGGNFYDLCSDEEFKVKIISNELGGINNIKVDVTLPPNLSFSTTAPSLEYCNNAETVCNTITIPSATGSSYSFVLPLPPSRKWFLIKW